MGRKWCRVFLGTLLFVFVASVSQRIEAESRPIIRHLVLDDAIINPVTAEYLLSEIGEAEEKGEDAVVIELDTPGGLLSSTRVIVKKILDSKVPVIVFVAPSGSRAGSAGVFITLAAHLAAMAPSTNIGAAHPVEIGGGEKEESKDLWKTLKERWDKDQGRGVKKKRPEDKAVDPMSVKVMNDTVAWVETIARHRGRNVLWAREAVTQSVSVGEEKAVALRVVDLVAKDVPQLLERAEGRTVDAGGSPVKLKLKDAVVIERPMNARQRILNALINPNIAYLLMVLGFYGLLFEITHPGALFPGIAGAVCLILALYSFHTLPTNYAGLALILLAFILFIVELKVPSYGLVTVGGVVCLVLGSLLLFKSTEPFLRVSLKVMVPIVASTALIAVFLVSIAVRARLARPVVGLEGLIGQTAEVVERLAPQGKVFVQGELWDAEAPQTGQAPETIDKGAHVTVTQVQGLKLIVRRNV